MLDLGAHSTFIVASYAITILIALGLIVWIRIDFARQKSALGELDRRGVSRRSAETGNKAQDVR
ncbi:heme exporter protein CcmD [Rhizobiales bacterium]|uniref:heme exporter protein CcmD n=1 Tax=Hongsoonwoonella zoysiae TaxID=2821844 RepID=UPI0015617841|nr:heme exporter protein CcmD [Hongsoonwoonella zoysiae]NRG17055.1 heme exporter protein CcmD [Hongsoonwoonella zoysiae]